MNRIPVSSMVRIYNYPKNSKYIRYDLTIYNANFTRKVAELRKNEEARAILRFIKNKIILQKSKDGNLIYPKPNSQYSRIPAAGLLNKKWKKNLLIKKKNKNHYSERIKVEINPNEWGLNFMDFFLESKEDKFLAKALMDKGFLVKNITSGDLDKLVTGNADLIIKINRKRIPIELTSTSPTSISSAVKKGANAPHGNIWLKVFGRIFSIFLYSQLNNCQSFVIINSKWKKFEHVLWYSSKLKQFKCYIIFTDFRPDWQIQVANKINKILKEVKA